MTGGYIMSRIARSRERGPSMKCQLELALFDIADSAAEFAEIERLGKSLVTLAEHLKNRAARGATHHARAYRLVEKARTTMREWDGVERRGVAA